MKGGSGRSWPRRLGAPITILAVCLLLYLPSLAGPLDTLDFSEFLLVLRESTGAWDGFVRLVQYYGSQGRVNAVIYGLISMNYQLFGTIPQGWHLVRFGQMWFVVIAAFFVLRRMGSGRGAAWLGAALFTVWGPATAAWARQTAEPAGFLFFLAALWLACGYADGERWVGRSTGITLAVLGMLFAKETFVVLVPVVLLVALFSCSRGAVVAPRWTARSKALVAGSLVATLGLGVALVAASRVRRPAAYADLYGTGTVSLQLLVDRICRAMLPVSLQVDSLHQLVLFPPNFVFLITLIGGGVFAVVAAPPRRVLAIKLGVGLLLPVLCGVVYLPWPRFELFYGLPFLFGASFAVATVTDALRGHPRGRVVWGTAWSFVLGTAALTSFGLVRVAVARREVNGELVRLVGTYGPRDSLFIGTTALTPQRWQNPAATLTRFAVATSATRTPPWLEDVDCHGAVDLVRLGGRNATLINDVDACGILGAPSRSIQRSFTYFDWGALDVRSRVRRVDVIPLR